MPEKFEYDPNDGELRQLFERNREWAAEMVSQDPDYFSRLVFQALPRYFYIGCSDARVPSTKITNLLPGDIFTFRNIANVVSFTDLSFLAATQFAVEILKVRHVIVTGHYDCVGVEVALKQQRVGLVDNWLRHIQEVGKRYEHFLGDPLSQQNRVDRLCELNVIESVANLCQTTIIQDAWARGQPLTLHGWVYGVHDGRLRNLGVTCNSMEELDARMTQTLSRYADDVRGDTLSGRNWLPD